MMGSQKSLSCRRNLSASSGERAGQGEMPCSTNFLRISGKSVMQKLLKHQKEDPVPIQALRPDVPDPVAQAIHKMMSKRPEDRYPAPAVVALALTMKR